MIKKTFTALVLILTMASTLRAEVTRVSAAISLKEALNEISAKYSSDNPGESIELNLGASGQLLTQIVNGAPVDVFVSAAEKQVKDLITAQKGDPATRTNIAGNSLVLIVPANSPANITRFEDLADPSLVKKLAMGEPRAVPAGQYAKQVLEQLKIDKAVADRSVFGENVRQVLDYVRRGEVDAGIVYATDAASAAKEVRVVATAAPSTHDPIVYPAILVSDSKHVESAKKFLDYLKSEKSKTILTAHGFTTPAVEESRPAAPATQP